MEDLEKTVEQSEDIFKNRPIQYDKTTGRQIYDPDIIEANYWLAMFNLNKDRVDQASLHFSIATHQLVSFNEMLNMKNTCLGTRERYEMQKEYDIWFEKISKLGERVDLAVYRAQHQHEIK